MNAQQDLFDTIDARFAAFHARNPHVFERIIGMLRDARRAGKTRVGIKMILEAIRWDHFLHTDRADGDYRINNDFSSRYARLVIKTHPDLGALLETRRLHAA